MIKNIIFDLGGVLIDINMQHTFARFAALGIKPDAFADSKTPSATVCEGVSVGGVLSKYQTGDVTTDELLNQVRSMCSRQVTDAELIEAWNACLYGIPMYRLKAIERLRKNGFRTYLLSNTNDAHWQYLLENSLPEGVRIDDYFDEIFLSQCMHLAKPDARIYEEVLRKIGAKPEECLFIDDAKVNTEAAAKLGINVITAETAYVKDDGSVMPPEHDWTEELESKMIGS